MVRSRLRRLSGGCAEILAIASLVGERFDAALLASAASLDDTVTIALLEEAAQAGLIAEIDEDIDGEPDYWRFSHSLTRRVTADELSRSRRARLHHRIGETLETRPGVPPAELAHHFGAAAKGAAEKAVGYERLAGERALREIAAEVAVRHFRKALGLLDRFGPDDQLLRCEMLLELAGAHDRAGEYASRDERFAEAADTARGLGNDELFLRAALGYGGVLPAMVQPDPRAQALLEEALERSGEQDSGARATASARLAHWLHTARPYAERRELSDRSVTMARGTYDRRTLATVLLHRCFALDGPDDVDDALKVADEIADIGADLSDPELTLEALRIRLAAQFENGQHSAATATARDMKRLAERMRHPEFIRLAAMWDVTLASLEGRYADAEKRAGELDRRLQQLGHPQADIIPVAQTFSRRWLQGQAAEYVPVFEALSASEPANHAWPTATVWCLAEAGARNRAADLLREMGPASAAEADKNYQWWGAIVGLSNAVDLVGDREWAQALYDLAAPYAGNNCTLGVATFLGAVDHWLGVLAGAAGRFTEAIAHLDAALTRHQDMGSRPWTALTQEAYGHVLSTRGLAADLERAGTLRQSAMRTAGELGLDAITNRPRLRG
jgi:tetratricopeptide (TPR) repeat protein